MKTTKTSPDPSQNSQDSQNSQNTQNTQAAQTSPSPEDLAEAERRGYLRGRNEALAERLAEPGLWEMADDADFFEPDDSAEPRGEVEILRNIRPNVWDRF